MSGFSQENLASLDFDFTGIRNAKGTGPCRGKGVLEEPTEDRLKAFFDSIGSLRQLTAEALTDESGEKLKELEESVDEMKLELHAAISAVGNGSPSIAELEELPPRALRAFLNWVIEELTDPKG